MASSASIYAPGHNGLPFTRPYPLVRLLAICVPFLSHAVACLAGDVVRYAGSPSDSTTPPCEEVLRAVFPWCDKLSVAQNFLLVSGRKYRVYLSGAPLRPAPARVVSGRRMFVTSVAFGLGEDIEHYYWYNQVLVALLMDDAGRLKLADKLKLPNQGQYMHQVDRIEPVVVNGETLVRVDYRYSDSVSTPRGWHTITKMYRVTKDARLEEVWSIETGFIRPAAASLPSVERRIDFHFVDFDGDGDDDIVTSGSEHRSNIWTRYRWDDGRLTKTESNE